MEGEKPEDTEGDFSGEEAFKEEPEVEFQDLQEMFQAKLKPKAKPRPIVQPKIALILPQIIPPKRAQKHESFGQNIEKVMPLQPDLMGPNLVSRKTPTPPSRPPPEWLQKKAALNMMIDEVGGCLKGIGWRWPFWSGVVWSCLVRSGLVLFGFLCIWLLMPDRSCKIKKQRWTGQYQQ